MSNSKIIIELQGKDNATGKIVTSVKEMEVSLKALETTGTGALDGIDQSFAKSISTIGKWAAAVGAAAGAVGVLAFKKGITAIDEFEQKTIGIAASLTNMAAAGQGSFAEMFTRNLEHAKTMYEELRKVDADRFASLEDMMITYNALVQKGYAARVEEAKYIGIITDRIALATQGQDRSMQLNQEIRALMDGQARAGSQLAQELESRLGPGWTAIVEQHKEAGDLLEWMAGLWPGIEAATAATQDTLEAQKTTLEGNLKYVGREGLAGAYADIVNLVKEINDYLRVHGDEVAGRIARGWTAVKDLCQGIVGFIRDMNQIVTVTVRFVTSVVGPAAQWLTGAGKGGAGDVMMGFGGTSFKIANEEAQQRQSLIGYGTEGEGHVSMTKVLGQTSMRPPGGAGGGGGGRGGGGRGGADPLLEQLRELKKEANEAARDATEAGRLAQGLYESNLRLHRSFLENRRDMEEGAKNFSIKALREVMDDEQLSYKERLAAGKEYQSLRLAQIEEEINQIRLKYGGRVSEDVLGAYKKAQIDQVTGEITRVGEFGAFSWESAWKRAAENVQDALADTIYNMVTQSKSATDVLKSLFEGTMRMLSDIAAQMLMGQAKVWLGGGGWGGGNGVFSTGGSSVFGWLGGLFGGGGAGAGDSYGAIADALGGLSWAGAEGGVLPGGFVPVAAFADGGLVDRPTLGLIGEAGPEIVLPLDKYQPGGNYQIAISHAPQYHYRPTPEDYRRDAKEIVKAIDHELQDYTRKRIRNFARL